MIKYAHSALSERGVKIQCSSAVSEVTADYVEMKVKAIPSVSSDGVVTLSTEKAEIVRVPYGSLVWAGGITSRPITKAIATNIGIHFISFPNPYSLFLILNPHLLFFFGIDRIFI
jgi:NADH dehydrogenase FAD-containing subunit